jgi:broad specificity phosphatase PhoE
MTTTIIVVRHGQTMGNIEQRFYGHSETDLTPLGIAQARAAGRRLADVHFDHVYTSDLSRAAMTTAHVLEGRVGPPPVLDPGLREMNYGEWEARPASEIGAESRDLLREFFQGKGPGAPGGETLQQVRDRTAAAVRRMAADHQDATVLAVSHGNAIMAMVAELLHVPLETTWSFSVDNTSITRLQFSKSGRFTLISFNDAAHIRGLALGPGGEH